MPQREIPVDAFRRNASKLLRQVQDTKEADHDHSPRRTRGGVEARDSALRDPARFGDLPGSEAREPGPRHGLGSDASTRLAAGLALAWASLLPAPGNAVGSVAVLALRYTPERDELVGSNLVGYFAVAPR
jgi:hypothetical protein